MIFNIQRASFDDGPGIRTVVFLKGCFLRCAWCHNPESQNFEAEYMANKEGGLSLVGKDSLPEEIIAEVMKDKKLYDFSGGGMTLSGGEPLAQPELSLALLKLAKEHFLHTCVETSGIGSGGSLELLVPYVDLWLFDIKVTEREKHLKYIGIEYEEVLKSLHKLIELNARIIIRSPIIPDINDNQEHYDNLNNLSKLNGVVEVQKLPYHSLGKDKYRRLGRELPEF